MFIIIQKHMLKLKEKFYKYFIPANDTRKNNTWILYPFIRSEKN